MPYDDSPNPARLIYRYFDGTADVAADPAVVWRKLNAGCVAQGQTWSKITEQWIALAPRDEDDDGAREAKAADFNVLQGVIVEACRSAFGMPPVQPDGSGTTESQVMAVLSDFLADREKKGASTANSPSSSTPTAGDPPGSSTRRSVRSATSTSTASSSTASTPSRPTAR